MMKMLRTSKLRLLHSTVDLGVNCSSSREFLHSGYKDSRCSFSDLRTAGNKSLSFTIGHFDLARLPPAKFDGRCLLIDSLELDASVRDLLVPPEELSTNSEILLGFDTESRPRLPGQQTHPLALIQLCSSKLCALWQLRVLRGIPPTLHSILTNARIHKICQGAHHEMLQLQSEFNIRPRSFIDLHHIALNLRCNPRSLQCLVGVFMGKQLLKNEQLSDWEAVPLTSTQIQYAATDAWVSRQTLLFIRQHFGVERLPCERLLDTSSREPPLVSSEPDSSKEGNSLYPAPAYDMVQNIDRSSTCVTDLSSGNSVITTDKSILFDWVPPDAVCQHISIKRICEADPSLVPDVSKSIEQLSCWLKLSLAPDALMRSANSILAAICVKKGYNLQIRGLETVMGGVKSVYVIQNNAHSIRVKSSKIHSSLRNAQADAAVQVSLVPLIIQCKNSPNVEHMDYQYSRLKRSQTATHSSYDFFSRRNKIAETEKRHCVSWERCYIIPRLFAVRFKAKKSVERLNSLRSYDNSHSFKRNCFRSLSQLEAAKSPCMLSLNAINDPRKDPVHYNRGPSRPYDDLSSYIEANLRHDSTKEAVKVVSDNNDDSDDGDGTEIVEGVYTPTETGEEEQLKDDGSDERMDALKANQEESVPKFQADGWNGGGGLATRYDAKDGPLDYDPLLEIEDLHAEALEDGHKILKGINMKVMEGESHGIMGRNGSGKSTLSKVIAGHPNYKVTSGSIKYKGMNLLEMPVDFRAVAGIFLAFQYPIEIEMVKNSEFLRIAVNERRKYLNMPEVDALEFQLLMYDKLGKVGLSAEFMERPVNYGFSGGEKKRNEILQMLMLEPSLCMLDETDSGLDVDSFKTTAHAVKCFGPLRDEASEHKNDGKFRGFSDSLKRHDGMPSGNTENSSSAIMAKLAGSDLRDSATLLSPEPMADASSNIGDDQTILQKEDIPAVVADRSHSVGIGSYLSENEKRNRRSFLIVTHYKKLLLMLKPQILHIMHHGRIVKTGGMELADLLDGEGFSQFDADDGNYQDVDEEPLTLNDPLYNLGSSQ